MKHNKYIRGERLTAPEAVAEILAGRYVYWHSTPKHPRFLIGMMLKTLAIAPMYRAVPNPRAGQKIGYTQQPKGRPDESA